MSLVFGAYTSLVGIAVVFATLLAVAAASEVTRRLLGGKKEPISEDHQKHMKVAAMAAVYSYIGMKMVSHRMPIVKLGESRWSAVARVEALRNGQAVPDEA